ncbi:MAG: hypothetical protein Q8O55_02210, partial [Dehalococcoidales bacterium]|nr:hypothetical protein [Dehalococcoidales bacterium]
VRKLKGETDSEVMEYLKSLDVVGLDSSSFPSIGELADFFQGEPVEEEEPVLKGKDWNEASEEEMLNVLKGVVGLDKLGVSFEDIATKLGNAGWNIYTLPKISEMIEAAVKYVLVEEEEPPTAAPVEPQEETTLAILEAAMRINAGKPYGGCYPDYPGVGLEPPQVVYCEGIMKPPGAKKAGYVQFIPGQKVPKEGVVSQFADGYNAIVLSPDSSTLSVTFKEVDEKGKQWKQRQQVTAELLTGLGYGCSFLNDHFVCARGGLNMAEDGDRAMVKTTAIFLSKLHGIDHLEYACVNRAVRFALGSATMIESNMSQPYLGDVYPYTVGDWNEEVCSKLEAKPVKLQASELAKKLGTVGLLEIAHKYKLDPTGSDAALAQKIIESGIMEP